MGKIYCISYGTKEYEKELKLNIKSAKEMGADVVKAFGPKDIDRQYYEKNIRFFSQKRGGGYWLWKPYIIDKMLSEIAYNDWLIYVDAGLFYINSIKNYIKTLEQREVSFAIVPTVYKEYQYTKRDIFVYTNTDTEEIRNTLQRQSGVIIIKKIEKNIELIREWLKYIQEGTMVNDEPNTCGKPNYEGFIENRHDQSIISVLTKKYGIGVEEDLYVPAKQMWMSNKLLCYHHSMSGNKYWIWLKSIIRTFI